MSTADPVGDPQTALSTLSIKGYTPESFREALERGLAASEYDSVVTVLQVLAAHLMMLREAQKIEEIWGYTLMLGDFLMRHPELPRLRDLSPAQQIGVRLELIGEGNLEYDALPTEAKGKAILQRDPLARRIIQILVRDGSWLETSRIAALAGAKREEIGRITPVLRVSGLIATIGNPGHHRHRATELAKRVLSHL